MTDWLSAPDGAILEFIGTFPTAAIAFAEEGLNDQYRADRTQHDTYGAAKRALANPKGPLRRARAPRARRRSATAPG